MSIHHLSDHEKSVYLDSVKTNLKLLLKVQLYLPLEQLYESFMGLWGGVQNDANTDDMVLHIVIYYYYAKVEAALHLMTEEEQLNELISLKNALNQNDFFQKFNNKDAPFIPNALDMHGVSPEVLCKWLMSECDNKISDLSGGNLLKKIHKQIDDANFVFDDSDVSESMGIINSIVDGLFAALRDANTLSNHPLYITLIEKITELHLKFFVHEKRKEKNVSDKIKLFNVMCTAQNRLQQYHPLMESEINEFAYQIQNEIKQEIGNLTFADFNKMTLSQKNENNKRMQSYVETIFVESLYNSIEEKKAILVCFLNYANKFLHAASDTDSITLCKNNLNLLKETCSRLKLTELNEDVNRYKFRIDLTEAIINKKIIKSLGEENPETELKRNVLYDNITKTTTKIEEYIAAASNRNGHPEIIKSNILLHYHLSYYYSILMMKFNLYDDIEALRNNVLENYKKAVTLTQTHSSTVDLSFTEDVDLIKKCDNLYNKHFKFSIKHVTEVIIEKMEKGDSLFDAYNLVGAAQIYEECWALINQSPALVMNNSEISPNKILWSLARLYQAMGSFEKAHQHFDSILLKIPEITAVERFEIRDFFAAYLAQFETKKGNTYFQLLNTHHMLTQGILNDIKGLKEILIDGGSLELQKKAMKELTHLFKKDEAIFHQFTSDVIHAFFELETRNQALPRGVKPEKFRCYHQILFDISTNIYLRKLELPNVNKVYIYEKFSQMALKAGNPQACYDFALANLTTKNYLLISRKLAIALADEDWSNNERNKSKKTKAIEMKADADDALRSARIKNPLNFFPGEKEAWKKTLSPKYHAVIDNIEALVQQRNPDEHSNERLSNPTNTPGNEKSILKKSSGTGLDVTSLKMVGSKRKVQFDDKRQYKLFAASIEEKPTAVYKETDTFKLHQSFRRKM